MDYPQSFIDRVAAEYGREGQIVNRLARGDNFAGRLLDDASQGGINPSVIIDAFESGSTDALLKTARQLLRRQELYQEWSYNRRRQTYPDDPMQWGTLPAGGETWPT